MRPVTAALISTNVLAFFLQGVLGDAVIANLALWPFGRHWVPEIHSSVGFEPWQLLTSAFLHANLLHLSLNMFALFMFGRDVEESLGSRRFLILYVTAILSAALTQLVVASAGPTVGASGGVFGVLLAFGWLFPRSRVTLIFPPIPMPAWLFVTLYGLVEL